VTYPEQKVEEKEDALRAFQPAADNHCCHEKVAASLRLQTSTSPALKKMKYLANCGLSLQQKKDGNKRKL
jgi:hypothetical protein